MKLLKLSAAMASAAVLALPIVANAQNSVWLPAPGSGSVSLSYVSQSADRFYIGSSLMALPFGTIKLNTTTLAGQYSLADGIAIDAKLPYARRTSGIGGESAVADVKLGLTWRFLDEFESRSAPTLAVRLGAIIAGKYETQRPDSIGDGASGYEASILIGRYVTSSIGLRGELGIRDRNKGVPNETFINVGADWRITPAFVASVGFTDTRASGGLDIGGPGFSPARFQQVAEKRSVANLGLSYAISPKLSVSGNIGKVTSGRNTSKSDLYSLGVSFDL
jgi:hypothetical protein